MLDLVTAVDAPMLALWDAPVHTAALRWGSERFHFRRLRRSMR